MVAGMMVATFADVLFSVLNDQTFHVESDWLLATALDSSQSCNSPQLLLVQVIASFLTDIYTAAKMSSFLRVTGAESFVAESQASLPPSRASDDGRSQPPRRGAAPAVGKAPGAGRGTKGQLSSGYSHWAKVPKSLLLEWLEELDGTWLNLLALGDVGP